MESLGSYLRYERELRQISLEEIAQTTRIPLRTLQHIEGDALDRLPGEVFTRGFVKSYAKSVGLDEDDVLERLARRHESTEDTSSPAPMTAITPPESGRRFGIAIALVILLILFTLALSIVMRPRQRDTPIELSNVAPVSLVADRLV